MLMLISQMRQDRYLLMRQDTCPNSALTSSRLQASCGGYWGGAGHKCLISTADICPVSTADIGISNHRCASAFCIDNQHMAMCN